MLNFKYLTEGNMNLCQTFEIKIEIIRNTRIDSAEADYARCE
jgi:hypothetical protein